MNNNILIIGPKCSGKTTFIYTLLKIDDKPNITIGSELYKYNNLYLWDCGCGLYYYNIISLLCQKRNINTIIIINNDERLDFIYNILYFIKEYNIKYIIIISNLLYNFKYDEDYIKSLNKNINFSFYNIDCKNIDDVNKVINNIEKYK